MNALASRISDSWFRDKGSWFRVWDKGNRVYGIGFRV
jgi:agmatine/peptidylarginine deiminase